MIALAEVSGVAASCDPDILAPTTAFLDGLAASYTMAQERNVHQVLAAAFQAPASIAGTEQAGEPLVSDLDDLLF